MIVTAELIGDLGTQKFIPIVRQNQTHHLPKFIGARFYVNFNDIEKFDEQYEILLRELYKIPAAIKPPLGKNPYAVTPSGQEIPKTIEAQIPLSKINQIVLNPNNVYNQAIEIARQGDSVAWREIVKKVRVALPKSLMDWRIEKNLDNTREDKKYPLILDEAVNIYSPLFALVLAGIQSGRKEFRVQRAVIDELLFQKDWRLSGNTAIVEIPNGLIFVFQSLCGSMFLDTNQLDLVVDLAQTQIFYYLYNKELALIDSSHIIGWPKSLGGSCSYAWKYIFSAVDRWEWLDDIFRIKEDYQIALTAYYFALHIHELAASIKNGINLSHEIRFTVPLSFLTTSEDILQKAYRLLTRNNGDALWGKIGVDINDMKNNWPDWVKQAKNWFVGNHQSFLPSQFYYANYFEKVGH